MRSLTDQLANYAAYHRDRRNVALHLVGIPLIVASIDVLLSRATFAVAGLHFTPAILLSLIVGLYYLLLDLRLGLAMALVLAGGAWLGRAIAALPNPIGLVAGIALFVTGWIIQLVGHVHEGRKPAFLDDLVGLLIGPLFVVAEIGFLLGLRRDLEAAIEARAGAKKKGRDRSRPSSL
jgi:uncharacterized membrane protein YGL010W